MNSNIVPEKFKAYNTGLRAEYDTEFEIMIDPETGIPCQEREVKVGDLRRDIASDQGLI